MKPTSLSLIICIFFFLGCNAQTNNIWRLVNFKTNYISKGLEDVYELPKKKGLIGITLKIKSDSLMINKGKENEFLCDDVLLIADSFYLQKRENDALSLLYPGDELSCLMDKNNDSCYVSQKFMNLLELDSNYLRGYKLKSGGGEIVPCLLLEIDKDKRLALFDENNFLIFYFKRW